jgi:hypothetical protein
MTRNLGTTKGAKKRADDMFSKIVRSRGACQYCGRSNGVQLQCAHIISRRYSNTRCVEANAFCLCASCHARFTDHPVEFSDFVLMTIGRGEYERLVRLSQEIVKVDWDRVAAELRARAKELGVAA